MVNVDIYFGFYSQKWQLHKVPNLTKIQKAVMMVILVVMTSCDVIFKKTDIL